MFSLSVRLYLAAAALLVAAGGLEVHRRRVVTRERARYGLLRDEAELFSDALATALRNPESCLEILGGRKLSPGRRAPAELNYAYDPSVERPLRAGQSAWPGTRASRLDFTLPELPDVRTSFRGRAFRRFRARLDAEFTVPERFTRGVPARQDVIVWLNQDDEVDSCFGPLSVGSVCNMMGGYYDVHATGGDPRCHQVLKTIVGAGETEAYRGTCRVSGLATKPAECHPRRGALTFQDKVGFRTRAQTLCRVCE